ncbi:hypothetical protein Tco_1478607 [Tanacetum coccineum]
MVVQNFDPRHKMGLNILLDIVFWIMMPCAPYRLRVAQVLEKDEIYGTARWTPDPETDDPDTIDKYYETVNLEQEQAKQELFETVKAFYACKQEECQLVSSYLLKMKGYLDALECLGYAMPKKLGASLILNSLNKNYDQFIQNYNMSNMGKTIAELHAMLKFHEKGIPKKAETPTVLAIREGKIQKDKKKLQGAKGKDKGKNKLAYAPKLDPIAA